MPISIRYQGLEFSEGFRADLIVEGRILVELKSLEQLQRLHATQVFTYVRLGGYELGLLINFGGAMLKGNIERILPGKAQPASEPDAGLRWRRQKNGDEFDV